MELPSMPYPITEREARAEARGEARGEAIGQKIGWLYASQTILLRILELKFGDSVPRHLKSTITEWTVQRTLDRWLDNAVMATSIEVFLSQMDILRECPSHSSNSGKPG
jgi:hypothetical protein